MTVNHAVLELKPGELLCVSKANGWRLACKRGEIWVTEQDRSADLILKAGEARTMNSRGKIVIQAGPHSVVQLAQGSAHASVIGLQDLVRAVTRPQSRQRLAAPFQEMPPAPAKA